MGNNFCNTCSLDEEHAKQANLSTETVVKYTITEYDDKDSKYYRKTDTYIKEISSQIDKKDVSLRESKEYTNGNVQVYNL